MSDLGPTSDKEQEQEQQTRYQRLPKIQKHRMELKTAL